MKHLYILLLVLPLIGFGQGWEQTFGEPGGDDEGNYVQQTTDGGFVVCGGMSGFESLGNQIVLIKTDENGNEEWLQNYGGTSGDWGYGVQQTFDGGYIITGQTGSSFNLNNYDDIILIKTDPSGNEEWSRTLDIQEDDDNEIGYSVQQTFDGGYIIGGSNGFIKTDPLGNEEWVYETSNGRDVRQTSDGGYILSLTDPSKLIKMDENGNEEWVNETVGGRSVRQTIDGGYILLGVIGTEYEYRLIKTYENGDLEWIKEIPNGGSVRQTTDGGYIITGETSDNMFLLKTYYNGDQEWIQMFGENFNGSGGSCVQPINIYFSTLDWGYIVTGWINISFNNWDPQIYLVKTNEYGNITSTIELPITTTKRELIKTTNILGQEKTTIKNQPLIEIYDDGSTEKKIVIE